MEMSDDKQNEIKNITQKHADTFGRLSRCISTYWCFMLWQHGAVFVYAIMNSTLQV